jgi:hypothetical protein
MTSKAEAIRMLRDEFERWEELLAGLNEEQLNLPLIPSTFSIKDTLAHLRAWQQISIARLEAVLFHREPIYPGWLGGLDPFEAEFEDNRDKCNETIFQEYHGKPWSGVHQFWREGFLHFLEVAEQIPEEDYVDPQKYAWLKGYPLLVVLQGSYEHHHVEHFEPLQAWLRKHGD